VVGLHAGAEVAVLHLGVVADLGPRPDMAAGSEMAVRPDRRTGLYRRGLDHASVDRDALTDRRVDDRRIGPDDAARSDRRRALDHNGRIERDVLGELDAPVEVDRGRVAHRHTGAHVALVQPDAEGPFRLGELAPVVDPVERPVVVEPDRAHDPAVLAGKPDEIGQVQLAIRLRRLQRADAAAKPGGIERVHARVDLVRLELLRGRVAGLDDPLDRPELASDHPTELTRVGREHRGESHCGVVEAALLEDRRQLRRGHERDIARQDEDLRDVFGDLGQRRADGIAGALRARLERDPYVLVEHGPDGLRGGRHHHHGRVLARGLPGIEDVGQHRAAAQRVEDLRDSGSHPRAEPGREDHRNGPARRRPAT